MATVVRKSSGTAANVVFGVNGITVTGTIVQGYDNDYSSDFAETAGVDGDTVAAAFYNAKKEIAVDCLLNGAVTLAPGDAVTIDSLAGHVKRVKITGEAQGFKKVRIESVLYIANALT